MAYTLTDRELDDLVRTVYGEAGNQTADGQRAVAAVILNRRAGRDGATVGDIVRARGQFEPYANPASRQRMAALGGGRYDAILSNIAPLLSGDLADPTRGATHFYAPKAQAALGRSAPRWDNGSGVDIGDHRFFRLGRGGTNGVVQTASTDPRFAPAGPAAPSFPTRAQGATPTRTGAFSGFATTPDNKPIVPKMIEAFSGFSAPTRPSVPDPATTQSIAPRPEATDPFPVMPERAMGATPASFLGNQFAPPAMPTAEALPESAPLVVRGIRPHREVPDMQTVPLPPQRPSDSQLYAPAQYEPTRALGATPMPQPTGSTPTMFGANWHGPTSGLVNQMSAPSGTPYPDVWTGPSPYGGESNILKMLGLM